MKKELSEIFSKAKIQANSKYRLCAHLEPPFSVRNATVSNQNANNEPDAKFRCFVYEYVPERIIDTVQKHLADRGHRLTES